jgi:cytochrome b561
MSRTGSLADSPAGYGPVSRALHWGMAALFAWQFVGAAFHFLADGGAIRDFFWGTHYNVGFTLWLLVIVRGGWGLSNLKRRPAHEGSRLEAKAATLGHLALYLLMVVVPTLAIMRAVGGPRGFTVYGIQLVAPGGEPNLVLTNPGNLLHGFLGWTLLVVVVGHVAMAVHHGFVRRDGTLKRMARGRPANR